MTTPKTKRVKMWAVYGILKGHVSGKVLYVEPTKKLAEELSDAYLGYLVLPCTITYKVPSPKKKRV